MTSKQEYEKACRAAEAAYVAMVNAPAEAYAQAAEAHGQAIARVQELAEIYDAERINKATDAYELMVVLDGAKS